MGNHASFSVATSLNIGILLLPTLQLNLSKVNALSPQCFLYPRFLNLACPYSRGRLIVLKNLPITLIVMPAVHPYPSLVPRLQATESLGVAWEQGYPYPVGDI